MGFFSSIVKSITGGDILGFAGGLLGANSSNKANSALNAQSIAFEREKAQNAHQWEVEDLRKAGLNPILSAGGSGASTGSPTLIPAGASPFAQGLNNANAVRMAREQIKQMTSLASSAQTQADTDKLNYQNLLELSNYFEPVLDENGKQVYKDGIPEFKSRNLIVDSYRNQVASTALQNALIAENIKGLQYDNVSKSFEADMLNSEYGRYLWGVERAINAGLNLRGLVYGGR